MSARDIEAGKANIKVRLNDKSVKGQLADLSRRLRGFGTNVMKIGAGFAASGGAILGSLTAAATKFASTGDMLDKMAIRTGFGVKSLQGLAFAADQSGSSLEAASGSILKMNRRLGRMAAGQATGSQLKAMKELGLSVEELSQMSPEQTFYALADAIKNYGNNAAAAGLAQRAFGTGVDGILPLLLQGSQGIKNMQKQVEDLALSQSDTTAAAKMTDSIGLLQTNLSALVDHIGAAVAPAITFLNNNLASVVSHVVRFIKHNREIVMITGVVAAGVTAVGVALMGAGGAAIAAAAAMSLAGGAATFLTGTLIPLVTAAAPFLPMILGITAAVVASGVAWAALGAVLLKAMHDVGALQKVITEATKIVQSFWETTKTTFQGISDALSTGDWALSAKILWAGVKVAFFEGLDQLKQAVGKVLPAIWDGFKLFFNRLVGVAQSFGPMLLEAIVNPFAGGKLVMRMFDSISSAFASLAAPGDMAKGARSELSALVAQAKAAADAKRRLEGGSGGGSSSGGFSPVATGGDLGRELNLNQELIVLEGRRAALMQKNDEEAVKSIDARIAAIYREKAVLEQRNKAIRDEIFALTHSEEAVRAKAMAEEEAALRAKGYAEREIQHHMHLLKLKDRLIQKEKDRAAAEAAREAKDDAIESAEMTNQEIRDQIALLKDEDKAREAIAKRKREEQLREQVAEMRAAGVSEAKIRDAVRERVDLWKQLDAAQKGADKKPDLNLSGVRESLGTFSAEAAVRMGGPGHKVQEKILRTLEEANQIKKRQLERLKRNHPWRFK